MAAKEMRFASRYLGYTTYVGDKKIKFTKGTYTTSDAKEIAALKALMKKGDIFLPEDNRKIQDEESSARKMLVGWANDLGLEVTGLDDVAIRAMIEEKLAITPAGEEK